MNKIKFVTCSLMAMFLLACTSTQVGLKENWIDERDVIALIGVPVNEWMVKAGRPTLVEINGDTAIYYYNYRPTMYASVVYDSTTFFKTWGTAKESKPGLENAAEVWGSRKDIMQIKVVNNFVVAAAITDGPDKKSFVRDLQGNIILDPTSGYNSDISKEQKIGKDSQDFDNAYNSLKGKEAWTSRYTVPADTTATVPVPTEKADQPASSGTGTKNPWEDYRYRQQKAAEEEAATGADTAAEAQTQAETPVPAATEPAEKAPETTPAAAPANP